MTKSFHKTENKILSLNFLSGSKSFISLPQKHDLQLLAIYNCKIGCPYW